MRRCMCSTQQGNTWDVPPDLALPDRAKGGVHGLQPQLVNVMVFTHWALTAGSVCRLSPMHSRGCSAHWATRHPMLLQWARSSTRKE